MADTGSLGVRAEFGKVLSDEHADILREGVALILREVMEMEVARLAGAERYERSGERGAYRNGYRPRELATRVGTLELAIPRLRSGPSYLPSFLEARRRSEQALLAVVMEAYVNGVSTRKVERLVALLGVEGMSRSTVSRICAGLDERAQAFRERPLEGSYPYLWLDARIELLLYAGAIDLAGAVRAKRGGAGARSDWMEIERARGISVTSAALQFAYRGRVLNLLDAPGHRDFSEDTYRVLTAADTAIMVIDAARGLEPQTLKLFQVCRTRGTPVITFVNKLDRPGREPLELLDEIEREIGLRPTPVTWPVLSTGAFVGLIDRRDGRFAPYERPAGGAPVLEGEPVAWTEHAGVAPAVRAAVQEELGLLDAVEAHHDEASFRAGASTPVFFGSALGNAGVRALLDAVVDMGCAPGAWTTRDGGPLPVDGPFSGYVFKVQANTDPRHRDRIAYLRVCSGRFERGMQARHDRTGRSLGLRHAHQPFGQERLPLDEAYPGDIVGLVNATSLRPGDAVHADERPVSFPEMPRFAPEHFAVARSRDASRYKRFRRGLAELDEEGVVQVLRHPERGDQAPVLAAVGPMQFEVAHARLEAEFGAPTEIDPPRQLIARETDREGADALRRRGVSVLARQTGELVALFESPYALERIEREQPELRLRRLLAG